MGGVLRDGCRLAGHDARTGAARTRPARRSAACDSGPRSLCSLTVSVCRRSRATACRATSASTRSALCVPTTPRTGLGCAVCAAPRGAWELKPARGPVLLQGKGDKLGRKQLSEIQNGRLAMLAVSVCAPGPRLPTHTRAVRAGASRKIVVRPAPARNFRSSSHAKPVSRFCCAAGDRAPHPHHWQGPARLSRSVRQAAWPRPGAPARADCPRARGLSQVLVVNERRIRADACVPSPAPHATHLVTGRACGGYRADVCWADMRRILGCVRVLRVLRSWGWSGVYKLGIAGDGESSHGMLYH